MADAPILSGTATFDRVNLNWSLVSAAKSYDVMRATGAGSFVLITNTTNRTWVDLNVVGGTTYHYRVDAKIPKLHKMTNRSNVVTLTIPVPASTPPVLSGTAGDATVTLSWTAVTGATQYRLARETGDTGFGAGILVSGLTGTYTNVTNGTQYTYRVAAVTSAGDGPWSNEVVLTPNSGGGGVVEPPVDVGVSGFTIPAPRTGYVRLHYTTFPNTQLLGQGPHPDTLQYLRPRPDALHDGTYGDSSGRGTYSWKNTTSEHDGVLDIWLHSSNSGENPLVHNGSGKIHWVSAPLAQAGDRDALDVHLIAKYPMVPGRKIAHLLWAFGTNDNGEDDFPEGKLDGGTDKGNAFHHYGTNGQQSWQLHTNLQEWHMYTIRYKKNSYVEFWFDGSLFARSTTSISVNPMHWVGQIETYLRGQDIPGWDSEDNTYHGTAGQGHILWDAFAIDVPA